MHKEKTQDYKEKIEQAIKISRIKIESDLIISQIEEVIKFFEIIDRFHIEKGLRNETISFLPIDVKNVSREDKFDEIEWTLKDSEILKLGTKL